MLERPSISPALTAGDEVTAAHVVAHLQQWRVDTLRTLETLQSLRQKVEETSRQLENPKAAFEYLEFFSGFLTSASEELQAMEQQLTAGATAELADRMRQLANNGAAEQRRTVMFRDKWVNKPLPFEQVRPMLTQIASDVRDQLADYKDLVAAAGRVLQLAPPPPPPPEPKPESFDRRALFRKIVRPVEEGLVGGGEDS
jgi:hypothetical protein